MKDLIIDCFAGGIGGRYGRKNIRIHHPIYPRTRLLPDSPAVGQEYEVIRVKERSRREGGNVYFVECEGEEVGVLLHELEFIER